MGSNDMSWGPPNVKCCETENFIDTDQRMKLRIRSLSGGLIEVTQNHHWTWVRSHEFPQGHYLALVRRDHESIRFDPQVVQLIHQSAKDFVIMKGLMMLSSTFNSVRNETRCSDIRLSSTNAISKGHAVIYQSCLKHLAIEGRKFFMKSPKSSYLTIEPFGLKMLRMYDESTIPLSYYAVDYMFDHAKMAAPQTLSELSNQLKMLELVCDRWDVLMRRSSFNARLCISDGKLIHVLACHGLNDLINNHVHAQDGDETSLLKSQNAFGTSPISAAILGGHVSTVRLLIEAGAKVDFAESELIALAEEVANDCTAQRLEEIAETLL